MNRIIILLLAAVSPLFSANASPLPSGFRCDLRSADLQSVSFGLAEDGKSYVFGVLRMSGRFDSPEQMIAVPAKDVQNGDFQFQYGDGTYRLTRESKGYWRWRREGGYLSGVGPAYCQSAVNGVIRHDSPAF